jgi:hypothetical protein
MTCREIEDRLLDDLSDAAAAAHVTHCEACRSFLETQRALDVSLAAHYMAPQPSAAFDEGLRKLIAAARRRAWWESAPDVLNLAGGLACSAICALMLQVAPAPALAVGAGVALFLSHRAD